MTREEGAVEEVSWRLGGEGISLTWSGEDHITVVTKNAVVGY